MSFLTGADQSWTGEDQAVWTSLQRVLSHGGAALLVSLLASWLHDFIYFFVHFIS